MHPIINPFEAYFSQDPARDRIFIDAKQATLFTTWKGSQVCLSTALAHCRSSSAKAQRVLLQAKRKLKEYERRRQRIVTLEKKVSLSLIEEKDTKFIQKFFPSGKRARTSDQLSSPKKVKFVNNDVIKAIYDAHDVFQIRADKAVPVTKIYSNPQSRRSGKHLMERLRPLHENESLLRLRQEAFEHFASQGILDPGDKAILVAMRRLNKRRVEFRRSELADLFKDFRQELSNPDDPSEKKMVEYLLKGLFDTSVEIRKHRKNKRGEEYTVIYRLIDDKVLEKSAEALLLMDFKEASPS